MKSSDNKSFHSIGRIRGPVVDNEERAAIFRHYSKCQSFQRLVCALDPGKTGQNGLY